MRAKCDTAGLVKKNENTKKLVSRKYTSKMKVSRKNKGIKAENSLNI